MSNNRTLSTPTLNLHCTMFDRERWGEIWQTLSRNKLRSFLTAFGVGWGIFMLILMLGAGNGLSNGVAGAFEGWASNACYVWAQTTSLPYKGLRAGALSISTMTTSR